jgi:hypothetical protein
MGAKFKISVEIINDDGSKTFEPISIEKEIPSLEDFMIGENFRENFDKYEKAVLKARKEAVEGATKGYLEEASKKKLNDWEEKSQRKETVDINESGYSIEAEIGRIDINTHKVTKGKRVIYDTRRDIFPEKAPRESYRTICFDELALYLSSESSFRKSEKILNRVRWQETGKEVTHRTLANIVESEGTQVIEHLEKKAIEILTQNGFKENGDASAEFKEKYKVPEMTFIAEPKVLEAVESYNEGKPKELQIELTDLHESYESPETSVNISMDDVGAKKQKESERNKYSKHKRKGTREYVKNTVIHIENNNNSYVINGSSIAQALKWLIAFLINNLLFNAGLIVFYVDGADDLRCGIRRLFHWVPHKIILDWYHLKKKCEQRLSLSIKGTINRNMVLDEVLTYLWVGRVDSAVAYLRGLDPKMVKDFKEIEKLIAYFDRNWSYIPCYALRKTLGLRNSSNRGEKSNHLAVSDRQKHNGMSWSQRGSVSLATVTALHINNEQGNWIRNREIKFQFCNDQKCA